VCCVLFERGVLFCVLCLIVVPLPPGTNPFAVKIIIIIIIIIIIMQVNCYEVERKIEHPELNGGNC
jgi:hypothetical protein